MITSHCCRKLVHARVKRGTVIDDWGHQSLPGLSQQVGAVPYSRRGRCCYLFTLVNMLHRDNHCLSVTMNRDLPEVGNGVQLFDHGSPGRGTKWSAHRPILHRTASLDLSSFTYHQLPCQSHLVRSLVYTLGALSKLLLSERYIRVSHSPRNI